MIITIVRDQRDGGPYTDAVAEKDKQEYGYFANQTYDIEVEITEGPCYKGSGEPDDPDDVDVSGGARVCDDVRYFTPVGQQPLFDRFVFRAGQVIDLTERELEQAAEQALEAANEPPE